MTKINPFKSIVKPYNASEKVDKATAIPFIGSVVGVGRMGWGATKSVVLLVPSFFNKQAREGEVDGLRSFIRGALEVIPFVGTVIESQHAPKLYRIGKQKYKVIGKVSCFDFTNAIFEGKLKFGMPYEGKMTFGNDAVYDGKLYPGRGSITHFVPQKKGKMIYPDGKIYDGEWWEGVRDGYGKMTYDRNSYYKGQWNRGYRHGKGERKYFDGSCYKGYWRKGRKDGKGKITYTDGDSFRGNWKKGMKHGSGVLKYADGKKLEGEWQNNLLHGVATFTDLDGSRAHILYRDGKVVRLIMKEEAI